MEQAIQLSYAIFDEMNAIDEVITHQQVLTKIDRPNEICWQLTWANELAAKQTTEKWPIFNSTAEFQALVEKDIYYGHFSKSDCNEV